MNLRHRPALVARGEHRERGETLIETLVSMVIMSIAVSALLMATQTSVRSSDLARRSSQASVQATNLAERYQGFTYKACTSGDPGASGSGSAFTGATGYTSQLATDGFTLPAGYSPTVTASYLRGVASSTTAAPGSATFGACPATDLGAQELTFTVSFTLAGRTQNRSVTIVKRDDSCSAKALVRAGYLPAQRC